ncbi:TrbI/VirB10 family protein [Chelativorans sp. M5D2P16]|uniref:TrbI/VirB10 family protein n=1 Tax=Chelativorans sp. M5D2P16 TaxID=3095678 RepID=UPI002ACAD90E|nr:TrbI/VirB10 family protein [Chelativorans sp. M5D2P16]MDZ5696717.1 TrbI/VirB10 family protein [Chelativorans sp. M5D2P16]
MSNEDSGPAPKLDPEDLALRVKPRPVRRINRRVLFLLSGAGLMLIFGAVIVALDPPNLFDRGETGRELYRTENNPTPEGLEQLPSRYSDLEPKIELGPPLPGDIGPAVVETERDLGIAPSNNLPFRPDPEADAARAERIRQARMAQQGRESEVFFQLTSGGPDTANAFDMTGDRQARGTPPATNRTNPFDALRTPADVGADALFGPGTGTDQNMQDRKPDFLNGEVDDEIYSPHSLQEPVSPYQLMAGTLIPASLITGLNSDLPGRVIAQVTGNVYDTPTGRFLLIPQGARVVGTYDSQVAFGQERALVVWQRIIMPDGSSILIDNLPATDTAGYTGLEDEVDFHTWRLLKGIALATLLGVGTELTFGEDESDLVEAIRGSAQDSANQAGQRITERNLNIQPTITIRPGWPLRIIVHKDIVLRPYGQREVSRWP